MILGTEANLIGEAGNSNLDEWIAWEDNEYKRLKKKKRETKRKKERPRVRDFRSCFITSNFANTKKKQTFPVCLIITLSFFNCDYHNFIFLKKLFF